MKRNKLVKKISRLNHMVDSELVNKTMTMESIIIMSQDWVQTKYG